MEKKDIAELLSKLLLPLGYKKKGFSWVKNGDEISKLVKLRRSQFGELYYIDYGFNINSMPVEKGTTHVDGGFGSVNLERNARINDLLYLENNIPDDERLEGLEELLKIELLPRIETINSEQDLLNDLNGRSHLNGILLVVKRHFGLEE